MTDDSTVSREGAPDLRAHFARIANKFEPLRLQSDDSDDWTFDEADVTQGQVYGEDSEVIRWQAPPTCCRGIRT